MDWNADVPDGATPFTYNGVNYGAGDRFESTDACQMVAFAQAFKAANPQSGASDKAASPGAWDDIQRACPAGDGGAPAPAPAGAPSEQNPAETGGDSGTTQGAPTPTGPSMTGGARPDGGPDQPTWPGNEPKRPPDGETNQALGVEQPQVQTNAGDPVDIFSGALYLQETDLEVPNVIMPLSLTRTYRSGAPAFGPLGWNWDHNYNIYLRELKDGSVSLWRILHEDIFTFDGAKFEPPPGTFERLERVPGLAQVYEVWAEGGNRMRFERPPSWVDGERIPLLRLEDRHGNALNFTYDQKDSLAEVRDADDRWLRFEYDTCGLLVAVSDHTERRYVYEHDEQTEQLTSVTLPATVDHPEGIARVYRYPDPYESPLLRHNIVSVEDTHGNVYLENRYDEDPSSWSFGRVTEQLYGSYLFQFAYTQLQYVPADAIFINVPSVQVEVMNPDFGLETSTFNYRGDLLDRRFRLNMDRSFRVVAVQYEYDSQGNLTTTTRPDGSQEIKTFDAANPDPRMRGKLLGRELTAAAGFPTPSHIVWKGHYELDRQLLVEEEAENGARTKYRYDFDLAPGAAGNTGKLKEIHHPATTLPDGTVQRAVVRFEHNTKGQVTRVTLADGTRQELEYGTAGNGKNRLVTRTHDAGGLDVVDSATYDAFGFDSTTIDGNGNTTVKTVNALGQMEAEVLPAVAGAVVEYVLHYDGDRRLSGVERPRGAYDDPILAGGSIEDVFERDVLGHPVHCKLSANTVEPRLFSSSYDFRGFPTRTNTPDGSRVDRIYDERGLLVEETLTGGDDDVGMTTRRAYDRTGRLTRVVEPGGATTTYEYDGFGRLEMVVTPNGTQRRNVWLAADVLGSTETLGSDGQGATRRLEVTSYGYDERRRLTAKTVQAFVDDPATAVALTKTFHHDLMDRVERVVDHRGGVTVMHRDGLGRVTRSVDPLGNEERFGYDANSNVVGAERRDVEPDGSVSVLTTTYDYDERNRQTATVEPDGSRVELKYDARDMLVARTDWLGRVKHTRFNSFGDRVEEAYETGGAPIVHRWELDEMSRVVSYLDPVGDESRYTLDTVGRIVRTEYPNGFAATRVYDAAGNVIEERLGSGVRFEYSYDAAKRLIGLHNVAVSGSATSVPDHSFSYDGLDRVTDAAAGTEHVLREYDSQGRIVLEEALGVTIGRAYDDATGRVTTTWPDGRSEQHEHDLNGTLTAVNEVGHGALGAGGSSIAKLASSGPGHFGEAHYPGNLRQKATYDERKRLVELAVASPAGLSQNISYRYDQANARRIEAIEGSSPQLKYFEHDEKYRLTLAREGFAVALPAAPTQLDNDAAVAAAKVASAGAVRVEDLEYDAADARVKQDRTGQPTRNYSYLPGHRVQSDGADTFAYHPDGAVASDGQLNYKIDALGRIVTIDAGGTTVCEVHYDALGRPSSVREQGRPVRAFHYLGNHLEQEADGATAVRQATVDAATGVPMAYHVNGATHYTLFDGRMNLVGLADSSGALLESYRYGLFGAPTILDPAGATRPSSQFGIEPIFGGQRFLPSAERYLARRRLMNPDHGLFLSPDPLGYAGSPSLYVYASQDPIDLVDPEGEFPFLAVLVVAVIGGLISGGLNATRQGIQMAEDPRRRDEGFSWGELFASTGIGAVLAPILVVAPELGIPLAGYGVSGGVNQLHEGNIATGTFDIVTSLVPFLSGKVRGASLGRGSTLGPGGLRQATPLATRVGRFTLADNNLSNLAPNPTGQRIGLGFARDSPRANTGHVAVIVEGEQGGFWFAEKNAAAAPGRPPGSRAKIADFNTADELPSIWTANARIGPLPFEYESIRVPLESASEAMNYGRNRIVTSPFEPFDSNCANCSHFAGDVLARGGFRGMGNGKASGLWSDFTNFNVAKSMTYAAPFWVRVPEDTRLSKK